MFIYYFYNYFNVENAYLEEITSQFNKQIFISVNFPIADREVGVIKAMAEYISIF